MNKTVSAETLIHTENFLHFHFAKNFLVMLNLVIAEFYVIFCIPQIR